MIKLWQKIDWERVDWRQIGGAALVIFLVLCSFGGVAAMLAAYLSTSFPP